MDSDVAPRAGKSVLGRALAILECFTDAAPDQTISSIATRTGLPMPTVHRLVATLVDWGGIERVERGRYQLGLRLWQLGALVPQARTLRDVAMPYLEDLYEATHGVVHLAILDGLNTLYIEKISGRRTVVVSSRVGRRLPLHATGPGKVLVAFGAPDLLERVLAEGLEQRTANTITDERAFRRALSEIRKTGFAVSRGEMSVGNASIAAPIFFSDGTISASVAVVTSPERLNVAVMAPLVTTVGRAITRALGRPGGTG